MSWDEIEKRRRRTLTEAAQAAAEWAGKEPRTQTIEQKFAVLFTGSLGEEILDWMRGQTMRARGPDVSNDALRHLEGQRFLVQKIEAMVERGLAQNKAPNA